MNDIDRSVDSFDFAMRRRFRFVELKADERLEMLASLEDETLEAEAIKRMAALNKEIAAVEDLNENYQIGASYFLKLRTLTFDQLWTDYLQPLLQEYVQGMYNEESIMNRFAKAYPAGRTDSHRRIEYPPLRDRPPCQPDRSVKPHSRPVRCVIHPAVSVSRH